MAFVHGKGTHFAVTDSGDTERNISQYLDNVSGLPGARDLSEVTAFGDQGTKHIPGLQNVTFSLSGHYDPTATTGPHSVLNGLRTADNPSTFYFGPEGGDTGKTRMTGECWMTSYTVDSSVSDKISFSAEFQVNGTVTVDQFAA